MEIMEMKKELNMKESRYLDWELIYKIGIVMSILVIAVFRRNYSAELHTVNDMEVFGRFYETLPVRAEGWFELLNRSPLVGLVMLNLLDVLNYLVVAFMYIVFFGTLYKQNKSLSVLALVSGVLGTVIYLTSNISVSMLNLANQYSTASEELKVLLLGAGESLLARNNPALVYQGMPIYLTIFFSFLGGVLFSYMMYKSVDYGKAVGVIGLIANGFGLLFLVTLAFAPVFPPNLYIIPIPISSTFMVVWYIMIFRKLRKIVGGTYESGNRKK